MSHTTMINESKIMSLDHEKIMIPESFNVRMEEKYNSRLMLGSNNEGVIYYNENKGSWWQRDIKIELEAEELAKILLELQKETDRKLIGSFNYTSIYVNGIKEGIIFLEKDRAVLYTFEVDHDRWSEANINHSPSMKIITL